MCNTKTSKVISRTDPMIHFGNLYTTGPKDFFVKK